MEGNKVENFLRNLLSAWQVARIYEVEHPKFLEAIPAAQSSLEAILANNNELIVGVVGNEFACGEDIFFELSQKMGSAIAAFKEKGVDRITFKRGIHKEELAHFIKLLVAPQAQMSGGFNEYLSALGIHRIKVGKIKDLELKALDQRVSAPGRVAQYKDCLDKITKSLDSLINEGSVDFLKVRFVTNSIMENLSDNYQVFLALSEVKTYDSSTFIHLLNVSVLSIYFAQKLGLGREECLNIGSAALLHDVGKLFISRKIIQKSGRLKDMEFAKVRSHTMLGADILIAHTAKVGVLPAVVAFEHHMGWDCKGYPPVAFSRKPHLASLIVNICDEYDALTQRRSYKRDYPPEIVYQIMNRQKGAKFPPKLLDKFFKIIGLWPKGTIVRLSDSRVGIVRQVNEEDIYRPKVEVVSEKSGEVIDLGQVKNMNIRYALNPLTEGKDYLDLI